tara:strand:+ start:303 stop:491 length:189 start_codon:yes stop_codon:yes gene_type:complete
MVVGFEVRRISFQDSEDILTTARCERGYQSGPSPVHYLKHLADEAVLLFCSRWVHSIPICPL